MEIVSLIFGITGVAFAIYQTVQIERIRNRDWHDALNLATKSQDALGHVEAAQRTLESIQQASAEITSAARSVSDAKTTMLHVVDRCADNLILLFKKRLKKEYGFLREKESIDGALLAAVDRKLPTPAVNEPTVRITRPKHGASVTLMQDVVIRTRSPKPIRLFVMANDGNWYAQAIPTQSKSLLKWLGTEWRGAVQFGNADGKPASYKLVAVATTVDTEGVMKSLPSGVPSEIIEVQKSE